MKTLIVVKVLVVILMYGCEKEEIRNHRCEKFKRDVTIINFKF